LIVEDAGQAKDNRIGLSESKDKRIGPPLLDKNEEATETLANP
jgi:hypothetical protein